MKYLLYIDYNYGQKDEHNRPLDTKYCDLKNGNIVDALDSAEKILLREIAANREIYLARILRKTGNLEAVGDATKCETYSAILCKRKLGWHKNNDENHEMEHNIVKITYADRIAYRWA